MSMDEKRRTAVVDAYNKVCRGFRDTPEGEAALVQMLQALHGVTADDLAEAGVKLTRAKEYIASLESADLATIRAVVVARERERLGFTPARQPIESNRMAPHETKKGLGR
jgi:hypothetical protein